MTIQPRARWRMQVLLFFALSILAMTGLTNWLLPHGGSARALRHLLRWIHEGAALGFLVLLAVHVGSQWPAIRRHLNRYGLWGRARAGFRSRSKPWR